MSTKESGSRPPLRVAVIGSGKGSNCQSIIDAIDAGKLNAKIVCVISDVENAFILERARKHGIPAQFISAAPFKTKLDGEAEQNYIAFLKNHGAEVIVLAGFMRIVKKGLLAAFPDRILNIHPALLPRFGGQGMYGMRVHEAVLASGERESGATVHLVDEEYDRGTILLQRRVPVLPGDTPETLAARVLEAEHQAYPEALRRFTETMVHHP